MMKPHDYLLFVDDSSLIPTLFGDHIQKVLGIAYRVTNSLFDAHKAIAERAPLCVVTSMILRDAPHGDAVDYFTGKDIPTIILTASFSESIRDAVLSKNAMGYYLKERQSIAPILEHVRRLLSDTPETVLVVDDSATSLQLQIRLLEKFRFTCRGARSAEEALAFMAKGLSPALVITDYHMPGRNGVDLVTTLRKTFSKDDMAIIGVSASTIKMLSVQFLKAGASDFLHKPFLDEEFECRVLQNMEGILNLRRLRDLARSDPLTQLANQQYFHEKGQQALSSGPCCLALLDLDNFKRINDAWGHPAGDAALRYAARILREQFPEPETLVARLGGEEFAILLPRTEPGAILQRIEDFRIRLAASPMEQDGGDPVAITTSIGLCVTSAPSLASMLQQADHYLQQAKKAGRNQTISDHWVM